MLRRCFRVFRRGFASDVQQLRLHNVAYKIEKDQSCDDGLRPRVIIELAHLV
jgi:hypothetical protein